MLEHGRPSACSGLCTAPTSPAPTSRAHDRANSSSTVGPPRRIQALSAGPPAPPQPSSLATLSALWAARARAFPDLEATARPCRRHPPGWGLPVAFPPGSLGAEGRRIPSGQRLGACLPSLPPQAPRPAPPSPPFTPRRFCPALHPLPSTGTLLHTQVPGGHRAPSYDPRRPPYSAPEVTRPPGPQPVPSACLSHAALPDQGAAALGCPSPQRCGCTTVHLPGPHPLGLSSCHDQPHRSEPLHLLDCPLVTIAATTGPGPSTSPVAAGVGLLNDGSGPLPHRPAGDSAGWRWQCGSALGQLCLTLPQEAVDKPVSLAHASGMHPPGSAPGRHPVC